MGYIALVADVSSFQSTSLSYFKKLKANGISSAMIKFTQSTSYLNENINGQIKSAFKAGMKTVGAYHYFHGNGAAEAKYFIGWVKAFHLDTDTVLAVDVEDQSLVWNPTSQINVFLKACKAAGYSNVITYGSASWFNSNRITRTKLVDKAIWVASYGSSQPNVANANAWQYTDNFKKLNTDASYDFDGSLSGIKHTSKKKAAKNEYYKTNGLYEVLVNKAHAYKQADFKVKRKNYLAKGTRIYGTPVKYGNIYRLKTKIGYFTANKKYIKFISAIK